MRSSFNFKTPYRDGTPHLVMTPLEFMQSLAALVPRPRLHLIRFHGVLAPNAALRSQIVPWESKHPMDPSEDQDTSHPATQAPELSPVAQTSAEIDMASCPHCGSPLTIIATIKDPAGLPRFSPILACPPKLHPKPRLGPAISYKPPDSTQGPIPSGSIPEPITSLGFHSLQPRHCVGILGNILCSMARRA